MCAANACVQPDRVEGAKPSHERTRRKEIIGLGRGVGSPEKISNAHGFSRCGAERGGCGCDFGCAVGDAVVWFGLKVLTRQESKCNRNRGGTRECRERKRNRNRRIWAVPCDRGKCGGEEGLKSMRMRRRGVDDPDDGERSKG